MRVLAIDPGPEKSGYILWDNGVIEFGHVPNGELRFVFIGQARRIRLAIEMVACYGMAVGKDVFETCRWVGKIEEQFKHEGGGTAELVYRQDVKLHLCKNVKAKDANIRQALIDKHGPIGTKKNPGKLYGVSGHIWAALAVADYVADTKDL